STKVIVLNDSTGSVIIYADPNAKTKLDVNDMTTAPTHITLGVKTIYTYTGSDGTAHTIIAYNTDGLADPPTITSRKSLLNVASKAIRTFLRPTDTLQASTPASGAGLSSAPTPA